MKNKKIVLLFITVIFVKYKIDFAELFEGLGYSGLTLSYMDEICYCKLSKIKIQIGSRWPLTN